MARKIVRKSKGETKAIKTYQEGGDPGFWIHPDKPIRNIDPGFSRGPSKDSLEKLILDFGKKDSLRNIDPGFRPPPPSRTLPVKTPWFNPATGEWETKITYQRH